MADETQKQEATGGIDSQNANGMNPDAQTQTENETQTQFNRDYVEQLRKEAAENRVKLKKFEQEKEERERKLLEEQGKHKELYESANAKLTEIEAKYNSILQEVEAYRAVSEKERKELLKQLPADMQKEFADLEKDKIKILLDKINAKPLANSQEANLNGTKEPEKKKAPNVPFSSATGGVNIYELLNNM